MDKETKERITQVVLCIKNGDKSCLNELHALIGGNIKIIAHKYFKNQDIANDLIQDFWNNIFKITSKFMYIQNGFSFLCKAMTNLAIDRYRKLNLEKKRTLSFIDCPACEASQELTLEDVMLKVNVEKAMEKLTEEEKEIVHQIIFEDKTIRDAAKALKISKTKAGKLKLEVLEKLKIELSKFFRDKTDE